MNLETTSKLTCPHCKFSEELTMPEKTCIVKHECKKCSKVIIPKEGYCCVFCSYGDTPCPTVQKDLAERVKHGY